MAASKRGTIAVALIPLAVIAGLFALVILVITPGAAAACGTGQGARANPDAVPSEPVAGYSGEQLKNAAYIMNAAIDMELDRPAQVLGVMTAMGESSLRVLDHGDVVGPDSRGLFQQRDNWGSLADRMDPTKSATLFFEALVTVKGWRDLRAYDRDSPRTAQRRPVPLREVPGCRREGRFSPLRADRPVRHRRPSIPALPRET